MDYGSLTLPGLARRSDKPSAARPPGGVPEGVGGRRPRIVKEGLWIMDYGYGLWGGLPPPGGPANGLLGGKAAPPQGIKWAAG
eukprot:1193440-Prorocentrum_minimum.AAC.2